MTILSAVVASVLSMGIIAPDEAVAAVREFFDGQIQKSATRAQSLEHGFRWPPARIGAAAARAIHLQKYDEAAASYQATFQDAKEALFSRESQNLPDLASIPDLAPKLFDLWMAENHLRWIFLRNTVIGMSVIGKAAALLVWLVLVLLKKQRINERASDTAFFRLPVVPDQPIAFRVPEADPKGMLLYQEAEELKLMSPLTEKILSCFAAFPDHPASLQDHLNIPGGLMMHTSRTIKAMVKLAQIQPEDERKLLLLMALCHDLGKLFAYDRSGKHWVDRKLPHDRISALIVAGIPELYTELSPAHREALILALRYYHNTEELPTMAPPLGYTLIERMHKADSIAYEQEKDLGNQQVEAVKPYLWEAFRVALPQININRCRGGYPEGFTHEETVFVLEHALRERTLNQLPPDLQQRLPIRRPSGRLHPAWPLLVEILAEKEILVTEVQGRKANPSALFNITASGTVYKCVVALSQKALENVSPDAVRQWMHCQPYEVQIAGGRHGG